MNQTEDIGGTAGVFTALTSLIAGIVAIVMRSSAKGTIAAGVLYGIASLIGGGNSDVYGDLAIWSGLLFIFAVYFIVSGYKQNKREKKALLNQGNPAQVAEGTVEEKEEKKD